MPRRVQASVAEHVLDGPLQALPFRAARIAKVLCPGCPMPVAYAAPPTTIGARHS